MRPFDANDPRWSFNHEWTGRTYRPLVVRWCGSWVGSARTRVAALDLARAFHADRWGAPTPTPAGRLP